MLQKVTRLDSVPTAEETVLTTEVPTKESRIYTLLSGSEDRNFYKLSWLLMIMVAIMITVSAWADPEWGQGVRTFPLKNHKNIGFLSNTGPDPLKITKLPS